jgi:hypothetical protein
MSEFIKILAPIPVDLEIGVQYSQIWDLEASRELLISVSPYTAQSIHPFYKYIYSFTKKIKPKSKENIFMLALEIDFSQKGQKTKVQTACEQQESENQLLH